MSVEREVIGNTVRWYWSDDVPCRRVSDKKKKTRRSKNKAAKESVAVASAEVSKLQAENAELKRQKEAWRDEFIILNDVMRDVSACNAYDDDEISRIDKSEVTK